MKASDTFESTHEFVARLRSLRQMRSDRKLQLRGHLVRKPLSRTERDQIFIKTAGRCHICGGLIEGGWEADHVFSHSLGGQHEADNYLPAHPICNNYRWFYGTEEFQWILKLGVWLRTQIERETTLGQLTAKAFCSHDRVRAGRRKHTQHRTRRSTE
jgi:5-methylcytosine-specific restriction endonuclease McrA